jgi:glycosyltransferase involved in cell wall biosynthesis
MRIAINGMFWSQPTTGSGQYLHGLLKGLARLAPQHEYVLLLPSNDKQRTTDEDTEIGRSGEGETGRCGDRKTWRRKTQEARRRTTDDGRQTTDHEQLTTIRVPTPFDDRHEHFARLWFEQIGVPAAAARIGADLLHVPYAAPPLRSSVPVVATVHDIIWWVLPEYRGAPAAQAYFHLVAHAIRRTNHILADSEHSRRDIIAHLGCKPEQVTTVLLAADDQYHPINQAQAAAYVAERYDLRPPFIYNVSGVDVRKNTATLVCAFARMVRAGGPTATLALAGRPPNRRSPLFPDLDALIDELGIRQHVRRIDAPREDNPWLYAAATAFAWPSRYEGFGLPPLEAMACGTPTVVANASSLPEVVGDAALLIAPDDEPGWTQALWRLLADDRLRADLHRRGIERARQFSYERVAQETLAVYRRVVRR